MIAAQAGSIGRGKMSEFPKIDFSTEEEKDKQDLERNLKMFSPKMACILCWIISIVLIISIIYIWDQLL